MADGSGCLDLAISTDTGAATRVALRIMATTDMHMHVLPYNYIADRPSARLGLARTAALIEQRRAERPGSLLFDNGDFLQGNALGDYVAETEQPRDRSIHPAVAAMNSVGYDAATLGNHDFNYGVGFLRRALARAEFPVTVANARMRHGPATRPWLILDRVLSDQDGRRWPLRIGVIGFLPPQTAVWYGGLGEELVCEDIIEAARRELPRLRAAGADLVVALAHSGLGSATPPPRSDNAAAALAALPGVDVVIAGHTHQVFPGPDIAAAPGIDPERGTLSGKPAVMAGFGGSHLGLIDLDLERATGAEGPQWRIADFHSRAEPVSDSLPALNRVARPALPAHRAAVRHYRRRIGRTDEHLHSFFSLIGDDRALRLVTMAQRWHVRRQIRGSQWERLPILSAAAPFRAGGRGGPDHYTDVPPGTLTLRNLADLYFFPNHLRAVVITGTELEGWLERSASLFMQVAPGDRDVPLINPDFPSYNFEVIDGVTWEIDLSRPARFDPDGGLRHPEAHRIRDLRHRGQPVAAADRFILVTNSYRLAACGLFRSSAPSGPVLLDEPTLTRDVLRAYIRHCRALRPAPARSWRFAPLPGATVLFETSPEAVAHLDSLAADTDLRIDHVGNTDSGFAIMRLTL